MKKQKIEYHTTYYGNSMKETRNETPKQMEKQTLNTKNTMKQETRNEFSLMDFIKAQEERKTFTNEQKEILENNRKNFIELGYNCTDSNLIDKRGIIANALGGTKTLPSESIQPKSNILNYCKNYNDLVCSCKIPVVEELNPQWLGETAGIQNTDPNISGLYFSPNRLGSVLNVSKMFLNQSGNMENELIKMIIQETENKLISTIFSTNTTEGEPNGIFTNSNKYGDFTSSADFYEIAYNVQTVSGLGYYVISPLAKKEILKLNAQAFSNNTLFGENYIIEPLMEDGIIAYIDLSKLIVCDWNYIDITIDGTTKAHKGENLIYLTGYYDYKLVNKDCASWFKFNISSGSGEGE